MSNQKMKYLRPWLSILSSILLAFVIGCPGVPVGDPSDGGSDTPGGGGTTTVSAQILTLASSTSLSQGDPPISITFTVSGSPDAVSGFFVPVVDATIGATTIGDRTVVAFNLPFSGPDTRFSFDGSESGAGFFRVGVLLTVGTEQLEFLSAGVVNVLGLPEPQFIQPGDDPFETAEGSTVLVTFDAGAPQGNVQWRLFYLVSNDSKLDRADILGTEIAVGAGNGGTANFSTVGLPQGDYELGLSVVDTGRSVTAEAISGDPSRIVTVFGPVVRVTSDLNALP